MTAALDLAEAVVARGHEGTEAYTLARALLVATARAELMAGHNLLLMTQGMGPVHAVVVTREAAHKKIDAARARLAALGEKP